MSSTQAVTGSDSRHPPVAVKLSEQEQKRVQQADGKLQDFMHQAQVCHLFSRLDSICKGANFNPEQFRSV